MPGQQLLRHRTELRLVHQLLQDLTADFGLILLLLIVLDGLLDISKEISLCLIFPVCDLTDIVIRHLRDLIDSRNGRFEIHRSAGICRIVPIFGERHGK